MLMNKYDIFQILPAHANPTEAQRMSAYMRDQFPFLGIPKPLRWHLSKEFLKEAQQEKAADWDFIKACWQQECREFQCLAIDYLNAIKAVLTPEDVKLIRQIATQKSWWDTIDGLDRIVGSIALRYPEVNKTLRAWSLDDNIWLRRIAIDHQLMRKEQTDTKLLAEIIENNLGQTEFFINKAIGWSLREYSKTNPQWVRDFINAHRQKMAPLSIREASKYI